MTGTVTHTAAEISVLAAQAVGKSRVVETAGSQARAPSWWQSADTAAGFSCPFVAASTTAATLDSNAWYILTGRRHSKLG